MELKLMIDGEEKVFHQPEAVVALRVKQSLDHISALEKNFDPSMFDNIIKFIANDIYEGAFSSEEFWAGMDAEDLVENIRECLSVPFQKMYGKMAPLKK